MERWKQKDAASHRRESDDRPGGEGKPSLKGVALSSGHLFNERLQVPADVPPFSSIDLSLQSIPMWEIWLISSRIDFLERSLKTCDREGNEKHLI